MLPQHGPGRKHERRIQLVQWQENLVALYPHELARGLIHSDGWRGTNRVSAGRRTYEYGRYNFTNRSEDIRAIFTDALDRLGVAWRPMGAYDISIARREAVAALDAFVEPKWARQ